MLPEKQSHSKARSEHEKLPNKPNTSYCLRPFFYFAMRKAKSTRQCAPAPLQPARAIGREAATNGGVVERRLLGGEDIFPSARHALIEEALRSAIEYGNRQRHEFGAVTLHRFEGAKSFRDADEFVVRIDFEKFS
jgi:hypothetical protein